MNLWTTVGSILALFAVLLDTGLAFRYDSVAFPVRLYRGTAAGLGSAVAQAGGGVPSLRLSAFDQLTSQDFRIIGPTKESSHIGRHGTTASLSLAQATWHDRMETDWRGRWAKNEGVADGDSFNIASDAEYRRIGWFRMFHIGWGSYHVSLVGFHG